MTKTNGKNSGVQTLLDLSQAAARDFMVRVEIVSEADPTVVEIPCRALTYKRYQEINRMVPDPQPPSIAGREGIKYDWQNPEYKRKLDEAGERRQSLRLAEFVRADIPGSSLEEKADWLAENLEIGIIMALQRAMNGSVMGGVAQIEARAATFQQS